MQIRIIRQTVAQRRTVKPGQVMHLPDSEARALINYGKAEEYKPPADTRPLCDTCGAPFDRRSPRQKYCTPECRP